MPITDTPHCDFCARPITGRAYRHRVTSGPPREVPSAVVGTLTIHDVTHRGYVCAECAAKLPIRAPFSFWTR